MDNGYGGPESYDPEYGAPLAHNWNFESRRRPAPSPDASAEESLTVEEPATVEHPHDPLADRELTFLLGAAYQAILASSGAEMHTAGYDGLRPVHDTILHTLHEGGHTSGELAEVLGISQKETVQLIRDLEKRGHLRQAPHPSGGRRVLYVLTDKAQQHLRAAGYVQARLETRLVEKVGAEGMSELRSRLAQLVRAQVGDEVPPPRFS
ncbi:MarR family winged helix-turn-helix transcriptional regulator [Kineosporia succinea]|uniref:DNA-binding MarR family transcriptional regulator n=1 Tax=Kineosporia succinea TaxID=84632 RepID=A0ABT9P5Q6_9ACTN|nr:MarR family winged helix-turn-helix transcriptional regulator [Kineosporia succinea]MDP9828012.1 DNA-binding MarR family transcriptional regulator [Kineosporia succinea]